jgi:hypothetical protein
MVIVVYQMVIGEKVDLDQTSVSKIMKNVNFDKIHNSYFEDKKSIPGMDPKSDCRKSRLEKSKSNSKC